MYWKINHIRKEKWQIGVISTPSQVNYVVLTINVKNFNDRACDK